MDSVVAELPLILRAAALLLLFLLLLSQHRQVGADPGYVMLCSGVAIVAAASWLEVLASLRQAESHWHIGAVALYVPGLGLVLAGVARWAGWMTALRQRADERDSLYAKLEQQRLQLLQSHRVGRLSYWVVDPIRREVLSWGGMAEGAPGEEERITWDAALDLLHPDERAAHEAKAIEVLQSGERYENQIRLRGRDGEYRWFDVVLMAQRDADGHPRLFGVMRNVDAAKRAEMALAEMAQLMQNVIDAIPCMIVVKDADLRYRFTNSYARKLFLPPDHAPGADLVGKRFSEIRPGPLAEDTDAEDAAVMAGKALPFTEVHRTYVDGGPQHWWIAKLPLPNNSGSKPEYMLTVAFDISALKEVEAVARAAQTEVSQQARQLEKLAERYRLESERAMEASRAKSDFLASMSHELRTPLNAVIGFSEIITSKLFGEIDARYLECGEDILASGRHLLSLINDILDMAKIEAGRYDLDIRHADAAAILDGAIRLVRGRALTRGLSLESEIDERLDDVAVDAQALKQIAINLLTNAIKFTPNGGKVTLTAAPEADGLRLIVRDTGIGILPEHQERIFEPFWQVEGPMARRHEGSGLGLAITRQLVELHHGRIIVRSAPDQGTEMIVTLFPGASAIALSSLTRDGETGSDI
ncbi:ATP-binding protein [Ferrovibrio sp.]|uniref:PAS domain-containing sensor histidine kinase n=1 Tax=Ferrovibrio sp. TaxID=1917215 RepID=UPI0025B8E52B|nr:ATP-binding protein [Ferrovibrio sp.]MBX3453909.1 PAS domain-containing protein [Ferrovibrio sp.]